MPIRKIKYKLEIPTGLSFDSMQFDDNEPLSASDLKSTDTPGIFEDILEDQLINESGKLRVIVEMSGQNGLEWSLNIWVEEKALEDNPIEKSATSGRADHDETHEYDD